MEKLRHSGYLYVLVLALFAVLLCSCNHADINDKAKRNTRWAWWVDAKTGKGSWIPLREKATWKNGKYTKFYFDGKVYETGTIRDGKYVDTSFFYDRENRLITYGIRYPDSTSYYHIQNGQMKIYWPNGNLSGEGVITNHQPGDKWVEYFSNGKVSSRYNLTNGIGWLVDYYSSGGLQDSTFRTIDTDWVVNSWYENGQAHVSRGWKNLRYDGAYFEYYENWTMKASTYFVDGERDGEEKYWYESGKLNGTNTYVHGKKTGPQKMYYPNGQLQLDAYTIDGKMDGEQKGYDENGKLIKYAVMKDGVIITDKIKMK